MPPSTVPSALCAGLSRRSCTSSDAAGTRSRRFPATLGAAPATRRRGSAPPDRPDLRRATMAGVTIVLPEGLDEQRGLGPDWARWLDTLPRVFAEVLADWDLRRDGDDLWHGYCSLVAPVVTDDGTPAVLKVSFDGDEESVHEGLALQHWQGDGVVRLVRADPHRRALLLERLHRRDLTVLGDVEACEVVAGLYPRIHKPAFPQLATITSYV